MQSKNAVADRVVVISPHPDDETLGCGGSLLRHVAQGDSVHWLIVSDMRVEYGYAPEEVARRTEEIRLVALAYGVAAVHNLALPPARLDTLPKGELVSAIGDIITEVGPTTLYVPFPGDVHTDHAAVFDAAAACSKWFRYSSVVRVLCYEALSETDFGLSPAMDKFVPNWFVNVSDFLERKVEIARLYAGEMGEFPFPRSPEAIRALARVRGAASGFDAAESFMLLRERIG